MPLCPTPLVVDGLLILWSDDGIVTCVDLDDGDVVWKKRVGGTFYASPIRAGEHLYNTSTAGEVVVLAASRRFQLVARNDLGEPSHSTAAVADGALYFRTETQLMRLDAKPNPD